MESATETFTVERELTIAARPETVWNLLVDPAEQSSWWGRRSTSTRGRVARSASR